MCNSTIGKHPNTITSLFNTCDKLTRNLNYLTLKIPYAYKQKQVPNSLIKIGNNIKLDYRNGVKRVPTTKNKKH